MNINFSSIGSAVDGAVNRITGLFNRKAAGPVIAAAGAGLVATTAAPAAVIGGVSGIAGAGVAAATGLATAVTGAAGTLFTAAAAGVTGVAAAVTAPATLPVVAVGGAAVAGGAYLWNKHRPK